MWKTGRQRSVSGCSGLLCAAAVPGHRNSSLPLLLRVRLTSRGAKWGVIRTSAHIHKQAHLRLRGPKAFQFLEEM